MPNIYCQSCIEKAVKAGCVTPCISYEDETQHLPRMVIECDWIASILTDIFVLHMPNIRAEFYKQSDAIRTQD
jgi:hypothetical protein